MIDLKDANVRRNRKYESLVDQLCHRKYEYSGKSLFPYIKDLMVFAAMVGYTHGVKEDVDSDGIQITLGTYSTDEQDGYIYLIALLEKKDAVILKNENINDAVKHFELYCNGGLSIIEGWLKANPGDAQGIDTLADKIYEQIIANNSIQMPQALPDISF